MSTLKQFSHLRIQLEDIKSATNNFSDDHLIGEGRFGKVYVGELLLSKGQTTVAFKRLDLNLERRDPEFWRTMMIFSDCWHENIVSLLGFNDDYGQTILVYEYTSNRSLDLHLNSNDLTWVQRLKICIGAVRGLAYLHNPYDYDERILHGDLKSANVLLDEYWNAKIADFGLHRFAAKQKYSSKSLGGTIEYCDPEFRVTRILRKESDVYSFGVVLFEVLCGRLCIDTTHKNQPSLTELVRKYYEENNLEELIHGSIKEEINPSSLKTFATIAYQCLTIRYQRPSMDILLTNLETALTYQIFTDGLKIKLRAILSATNSFAEDHCIGVGGFGKVYKGELFHSKEHTLVALKRLNRAFGQGNPEFWKEVNTLSRYRHENIVNLLGFCNESNEKILVYEFVPNRSLDLSLNKSDLTWVQRLHICIGAAQGLAYLHNPDGNQQSVWHLDIKSGNILLDASWNAKIADLGLCKFGHANQGDVSGKPNAVGTLGYCDPVYVETGSPSKESDVYSFGVVLFEVLSGRLCIGNTYEYPLTVLAQRCYEQNNLNAIIHKNIKSEIRPPSLRVFTAIAYQCLKRDRGERPSMNKIVKALKTALEYQVIPPLPLAPPSFRSCNEYQRPLKPLHWEKTPPMVEGSIWDVSHNEGIQSRALEIDSELESLFCKHKYRAQQDYKQPKSEYVRLVHPERACDCEIVLHKSQLPLPDLMKSIHNLDSSAVSVDQVYDLIEICPTNEEMEMLKRYTGEKERLGQCEQFFLECAKIPRIETKLRVFTFIITFSHRLNSFMDTIKTINYATKQIKESTKLVKIMQIILTMGNKLNAGTTQGSAWGFKLDSLEKLGDTYATDMNISLLHFLCKVVAEKTPELLDFYKDLIHLPDAYWIQTKNLYEDKSAMIEAFEMVEQELNSSTNDGDVSAGFQKALKSFLDRASPQLSHFTSFFDEVDRYADSLVVYFGEDPSHFSWKQVISSLVHFVEMFKKAHDQNKRWANAKKKKLNEEAVKKSTVLITSMKIKP